MLILDRDDDLNLGTLIFRSPNRSHLKHAERNISGSVESVRSVGWLQAGIWFVSHIFFLSARDFYIYILYIYQEVEIKEFCFVHCPELNKEGWLHVVVFESERIQHSIFSWRWIHVIWEKQKTHFWVCVRAQGGSHKYLMALSPFPSYN